MRALCRPLRSLSTTHTRLLRASSSFASGPGGRSSVSSVSSASQAPDAPAPVLALASPAYALLPDEVHCVLGLNGSGKSRFLRLAQHLGPTSRQQRVASLSLDAHRAFVARHGERVVADVLGGVGSPSARDLIVRLGLYPVWESRVKHLSTGEMRKLMLAVALLETPRATVLLLDQPFDGLDVAARKQLEWMLGQLTRGFTRLLVETGFGRNQAFAYKTQVLLVANRLEQVFPDILSHVVLLKTRKEEKLEVAEEQNGIPSEVEVVEWPRQTDDGESMMKRLRAFFEEENARRPPMDDHEMVALVKQLFEVEDRDEDAAAIEDNGPPVAVRLDGVSIAYDKKRTLLESVYFVRHRHEHWVLLGPNGSGKSSLMRVLMQTPGHGLTEGEVRVVGQTISPSESSDNDIQGLHASTTERVEAISTDQHIQLLQQSLDRAMSRPSQSDNSEADANASVTAMQLIAENARHGGEDKAALAAKLLRLDFESIRARPLAQLSQGEQKLVLIARALAASPELLILDEITHGLDPFNRAHVLRVVNAIGKFAARKTHLILITHHEDEITDCFANVFEIRDKQLVERDQAA